MIKSAQYLYEIGLNFGKCNVPVWLKQEADLMLYFEVTEAPF